ncbi:MAG: adenine deaminase [Deltaproteobacteria bacterium]|jgi:adenine deaminase|nr:adenine deaminase [Deltaproteobacteria bacterium]
MALSPLESEKLARLIQVARGRAKADLVIRGGSIFDVFSGRFVPGDLAIWEDRLAGVGPPGSYAGERELLVTGYLVPGFVDSHVHVESSLASPQSLAPTLLENGVTAVVADPHEIVNVAGLLGLDYFLASARVAAMDFFLTLPSCVPASNLEKGGSEVTAQDLSPYFGRPGVLGLGEMMNYPGVLAGDPEVLAKLTLARSRGALIDGHAPMVGGLDLSALRASGVSSDHEAATVQEAVERLERGFWLMIREGTAARNLVGLWPAITRENARFCLLATDDRHARDLVNQGGVNYMISLAQNLSQIPLPDILRMATINPAQFFGFKDRGALAPGYLADLALYPDLTSWKPRKVWKNGRLVVDEGYLGSSKIQKISLESGLLNSVRLAPLEPNSLKVPATGSQVRVIGLKPDQIVTDSLKLSWPARAGFYEAEPGLGIVKMAIWNRYGGDGVAKVGFLKGLGLQRGALAQTISHDSHHLVAAGVEDADILLAARTVVNMGGGLALAAGGQVLGTLALPLGGLMSNAPLREIAQILEGLDQVCHQLGTEPGRDPFLTLGFMSLPVIPRLKLTVAGLVEDFQIVDLVSP